MLLRLTQHDLGESRHRVALRFEGDGAPREGEATFAFALTAQDEEDVRWYLEDFLQYPQDPAPRIARRVERRIAAVGEELFRAVFQGSEEVRDLWAELRRHLPETRIEIAAGVAAANTLPWELLRDPRTRELALAARAFVRAQPRVAVPPRMPASADAAGGPVRILAVICRPSGALGGADVPFRSVASRLIKGLDASTRSLYDLDLLRPPTFEQLGRVLRQAKEEGRPYHAVHFDGHGAFRDFEKSTGREGKHGYVAFEHPERKNNQELIDGVQLGRLLYETGVPVLVLNSCHSAHGAPAPAPAVVSEADFSFEVHAYGSLAQEVMDAGVGGVVAMRYFVYVATAAQLVAELYAALAHGRTLGEAVTLARKNLADRPLRDVADQPRELQDWSVPVVYEAAPLRLFPETTSREAGLSLKIPEGRAVVAPGLDATLPAPPDAGFYGRDETLLALDRAFDRDRIVLLHAYAGSGKTATAAEFARWYAKTGGVDGPVLWSSFEHYLSPPRLIDRVGQAFETELESAGIHWLALADDQRRAVALQILAQKPVLWIWDNVEPVAGFPPGTPSAWGEAEQKELVDFLRALRETKAKVLLTSRRDERAWLGDLPTRVKVPPMPMLERFQLARALAEKHGRRLTDVEDWNPLLAFTEGNPLTLTVLVGQALREGFKTKAQIEAFVERLRAGEAAFADEAEEGRSRSLGASLAYGFETAFSEEERGRLALLHLFQGFVDVVSLMWMGHPENSWCLDIVRGVKREEWIALLDRAAEVGLLESHGGRYYGIHPAIPWFFRSLFEKNPPEDSLAAIRAFVEAIGVLGYSCLREYNQGNRDVIGSLTAEEANLLRARRLARKHGWWSSVIKTMQGLDQLYSHTGRVVEWRRLVEETVPDFIDPTSGELLERREEHWEVVMDYQIQLAERDRQWPIAERLRTLRVERARHHAEVALSLSGVVWPDLQALPIRSLAVCLLELGDIRRELSRVDCVPVYEESLQLLERIGDRAAAAAAALSLGHVYTSLPVLRNLNQAQGWYEKSLKLFGEQDRLGQGRCLAALGNLALKRADGAISDKEWIAFLKEAVKRHHEALEILPTDAVADLAVSHNALGVAHGNTGDIDRALPHLRQTIRLQEDQSNIYRAAETRINVAQALLNAGRRKDAMEYAIEAIRGFESFGDRAAADIQATQELIEEIQRV